MATPSVKDVVGRTFDATAEEYERIGPEFFNRFGRRLVEVAEVGPGQRVLDVGCGAGAALVPAAAAVGPGGHVLGIDLAPGMVRRSEQAAAECGFSHVEVRVGDAEDPPLPPDDRDRVLAAQVLFFLPDLPKALAAYRRILRPDGVLAFSSWGKEDPRWEGVYRALFGYIPEGQVPKMTPSGGLFETDDRLSDVLTTAGFVDVKHLTETYELVFDSAEQWLEWSRTHGGRAYWDAMPPARHDAARSAALEVLASLADDAGRLTVTTGVRYTRAG